MNPVPSVRLWGSIALCLVFAAASVAAAPSSTRPGKRASATKKPPATFEDAVDHLVKNLKKDDVRYLKSYPKCDLISFHMGWALGIRNQLGLWNGNESLLESCARHAHKDSIHPDEASSLLIRGVWDKLHEDLSLTDFDTVYPTNYFHEIDRTLQLAKSTKNTGYLASLPGWMYQVSRFSFFSSADSARSAQLTEEARKQARRNDSLSPLAILYMTFHGGNGIMEILDSQFLSKSHSLEMPSYTQEGALKENSLLQPDSMLKVPPKATVYFWQTLSRREFAAKCFGSLYDKQFKDADDFQRWSELRRTNRLMRWAWKGDVASDDFQELSSDPRKFLEVLLLTNRLFREPMMGEFPLTPSDSQAADVFIHFMGYEDSAFQDLPYDKRLGRSIFLLDSATLAWNAKATHAMVSLANRLSTEEIFQILDRKATEEYDRALRTDDLQPYKILGHTLLASQGERILRHPDKKRTFDLCYRYWKEEFLSFPVLDYLTELLFQIDPQRARALLLEEFKSPPTEGSFTRNAILRAMIRQDLSANRDFLRKWFWKTYNKNTDYHPNETQAILQALENQDGSAKELWREFTSDRRYRKDPPLED